MAFSKNDTSNFLDSIDSKSPQEIVMNQMKLEGRDITDAKQVYCDVCDTKDGGKTKGGYILYRKDETPDFICETCWKEYTIPEKPLLNSEKRRAAKKYGIGRSVTTEDKVVTLDVNNTFTENVLKVRANPHIYGQASIGFTWNIISKNKEGSYPNKKIENEDKPRSFCSGCKKMFFVSELRRCSKCKLDKYCTEECQKSHWKTHKKYCKDRRVL